MDIGNIQIKLNTNYPTIINATNDARTVLILKDLISSRYGELNGALQYFYQSSIARVVSLDISEMLQDVGWLCMEHVELLMNAIVEFGGMPKYENAKTQIFNTSNVKYSTKLKDMLEINIFNEQQAINNFINAEKVVKNQSLKEMLNICTENKQLILNKFKYLNNNIKFLSN